MSTAPAKPKRSPVAESPGVLRVDETYTLAEFAARVGWSRKAMRSARKAGLSIKYFGGRGFISGKAAISFLESEGKDSYR